MEYIKSICSATSANYPFYFLLRSADVSIADAISVIEGTTSRGATKKNFLERLSGKRIPQASRATSTNPASIKKGLYRDKWLSETVVLQADEVGYCITALLSLAESEVVEHNLYIRRELLEIYDLFYENAKPTLASDIRKAISRVDEVLFFSQ